MNKVYVLIILIIGLFLNFSNITYASMGDIWISPSTQNISTNSNFDVDIYVDAGTKKLGAFNMYLDFDPTKISIDTSKGDDGFSKGTDTSNYSIMDNSNDVQNGHYRFAGINGGDANIASGNSIHVIKLHAKTTQAFINGSSTLSIRVNELSDDLGNNITVGNISNASINYLSQNIAPVIVSNGGGDNASLNIDENQTFVTTVKANDSDAISYTITGGSDQSKFNINNSTGTLTFKTAPDFENPSDTNNDGIYEVEVTASDGVLSDTQILHIIIKNIDENNKSNITISSNGGGDSAFIELEEGKKIVTIVSVKNSKSPARFTITGGLDKNLFKINPYTGKLSFLSIPNFKNPIDSNKDNIYEVEVKANDSNSFDTQIIKVKILNIKEIPNKIAVYRLFNTKTGAQLYTRGEADRDKILRKWPEFKFTDGTPAFYADIKPNKNLTPIYRLYNTKTGAQLYTRGEADRDKILRKWPDDFEFSDGTPAFYASLSDDGTTPIYRLYNKKTGMQLYTRGEADRDKILRKWPKDFEFSDGAPAFYANISF